MGDYQGSDVEVQEEPSPKLSMWQRVKGIFVREKVLEARSMAVDGTEAPGTYPENAIRNQKYNVWNFVPLTIYEQFKYFINFYYLLISLSQLIPALKVGFMFTYVSPLVFVVALAMAKELYDDVKRMLRDRQVNNEKYSRLTREGLQTIAAADIKVGHIIQLEANRRVPADMLLLRTTNESGASFIRTDQLDGETDWKLRRAPSATQQLVQDSNLFDLSAEIYAEAPRKDIYDFVGTLTVHNADDTTDVEPLTLEHTLWASTVLASDTVVGIVAYTGAETRSVINTSSPATKKGILDEEVNRLTQILFVVQGLLAFVLMAGGLFKGVWWLNYFKFLILISSIIPISMRVNLDFAKLVYSFFIVTDPDIPGCTVRNTSIPEELGRITYLLSDKTGTLTQNDMIFRKLNLGLANFSSETLIDVREKLEQAASGLAQSSKVRVRNSDIVAARVQDTVTALALCHNVTPVIEDTPLEVEVAIAAGDEEVPAGPRIVYQASSPDEVALVKFTESVGVTLTSRTRETIAVTNVSGELDSYHILENFPFSSSRKRMGIIVQNDATGEIRFLMKGADVIMAKIVEPSEWLEEECLNLAREGLRTLVVGQRILSQAEYDSFRVRYHEASTAIEGRESKKEVVVGSIESGLQLLALTGVEDKLQENVKGTLENLRNAGIKIWMLTGDKRETATCIAISSRLVSARNHELYQFSASTLAEAELRLADFTSRGPEAAMVIDGDSLEVLLTHLRQEFYEAAKGSPAVVCCRCSPTQKEDVVKMIRQLSSERTAAIGDGGNDVSMIQAAHVGVGIVGKEGKQGALAADFSVLQFSHLQSLLFWHGRNSYKRSAMMAQFIIQRGLVISFIQALFSAIFYMAPVTIYTGMLLFGYSVWYTLLPVFALVLDEDVQKEDAFLYPELYKGLRKGRSLNLKTFLMWFLVSCFQAFAITVPALFMDLPSYYNFVAVTFTALVFSQLIDVAIVTRDWHILMVLSEVSTFALYPLCMLLLPGYYYIQYCASWSFWWRSTVLTVLACLPVAVVKGVIQKLDPPAAKKLY